MHMNEYVLNSISRFFVNPLAPDSCWHWFQLGPRGIFLLHLHQKASSKLHYLAKSSTRLHDFQPDHTPPQPSSFSVRVRPPYVGTSHQSSAIPAMDGVISWSVSACISRVSGVCGSLPFAARVCPRYTLQLRRQITPKHDIHHLQTEKFLVTPLLTSYVKIASKIMEEA